MLSKNRNLKSLSKNAAILLPFLPLQNLKFLNLKFQILWQVHYDSIDSISSKLYRTSILD